MRARTPARFIPAAISFARFHSDIIDDESEEEPADEDPAEEDPADEEPAEEGSAGEKEKVLVATPTD